MLYQRYKHMVSIILCFLMVFFFSFAQAADIHRDDLSTEIREFKIEENLYRVGDRAFALYYITNDGVIVVDPMGEKIATKMMEFIRARTNLPVKYVFYSHNHWDHIAGGQVFKDAGAIFIAHAAAAENIGAGNPSVVTPDEVWSGSQKTFTFGGKNIEMTYFGEKNHGEGNVIFKFTEYNSIYIADLVVPDRVFYLYMPDSKPKNWLSHLYQIQAMDFDKIYPAHVRTVATKEDLNNVIAYFEDLYKAVDEKIAEGVPFFEIPAKVDMPKWKHLLFYDEWLKLNVMRILQEKSFGQ